MKNWYLLYTLFNREAVAVEAIAKKGLETFLPMTQQKKPDGVGKWKRVTSPLFPRYLFIQSEQEKLSEIKRLQGVAYVVSEGECALTVPEMVIEEIKARVIGGYVKLDDADPDCPFKPKQDLYINRGSLAGLTGVFKQWTPEKQKVGILLSFLGREQIVQFNLTDVSPAAMYSEF